MGRGHLQVAYLAVLHVSEEILVLHVYVAQRVCAAIEESLEWRDWTLADTL